MQEKALNAALLGLDYFLRTQITDPATADCGRYPYIVNCQSGEIETLTTNWTTGVVVSIMLSAYKVTGEQKYLDSARLGVSYLRSLQDFSPWKPRTYGVLHEETPQSLRAHPRDALTGAWAMFDYSILTGDEDAKNAALAYADWFHEYALGTGYPYWTVNFDNDDWQPKWYGSFHSGSAFFFYRLCRETGKKKYEKTMRLILDFYNKHLLQEDGSITVIKEHGSFKDLDDCADPAWAPLGWITMHKYNDDFGALANLAAWQRTGETAYRDAALRFLNRMRQCQKADGGFGPDDWKDTIPSAGGAILQELLMARRLGAIGAEFDETIEKTVHYLLGLQYLNSDSPFHGSYHGMTGAYTVDRNYCNTRAAGYAVMSLLTYASEDTYAYRVAKRR